MRVDLASVEQVFAWLDELKFPVATATVTPSLAVGRALLLEFRAPHGLPQRDVAVMDGMAVLASHTLGAGPYNPLPVNALPVRAGAAIPSGCDAVLPEDAVQDGMALEVAACGEAVVAAGSQLRRGARVFPSGHVLRAQDLAVLAELGIDGITVRAGLLVLDEVPEPLHELALALLNRDLSQFDPGGDFVLTTSPGPDDRWDIGAVALRPGGACRFGWRGGRPVLMLPADALGFTMAYELFVSRLLRRLGGVGAAHLNIEVKLATKLVSSIGHTDLALVRLEDGVAIPLPDSETSGAAGLARADGFVVVPAMREGIPPGDLVNVWLLAT